MIFLAAKSSGACLLSPQECLTLWHHIHISWLTTVFAHASLVSRFLFSSLPSSQYRTTTARYPPTGAANSTGRGYPRSAHLCARLQPLVHLVDPILRLDHVWRVSSVEGSERRRVERIVSWVRHGGSWRGARRNFNIQRARQRTWECDALRRPPVGSSRCRGWAALCKLSCLVRCYSVEPKEKEEERSGGGGRNWGGGGWHWMGRGGSRFLFPPDLHSVLHSLAKFKSDLYVLVCVFHL